MRTIATLGPSVRLVVFQFHVKNGSVPEGIPKYSDFHKAMSSHFEGTGVRVMEPTLDVLSDFVTDSGYHLIDAWYNTEEEDWNRSVVRFVFCRKEYVNRRLRPEFVAQQDGLLGSFKNLAGKNLWKTMVHINPFFSAEKRTKKTVLMLDCNSRKQTTKLVPVETGEFKSITYYDPDFEDEEPIIEKEPVTILMEQPVTVFHGGRETPAPGETFSKGIGPKILLTDKANRLKLNGNEVVLVVPAPVSETVSAPVDASLPEEVV